MSEQPNIAPENEQSLCVSCGFCCDGTLFLHACLNPGERGNLPEEIEKKSFTEDGNDYFWLPCNYFHDVCVIYKSKRADVCSSFRCQLLKDFAEGKLALDDAREIVREAVLMRKEVTEMYRKITGDDVNALNFRKILLGLGKIMHDSSKKELHGLDYEMLVAKCNIFEALLIKHIRSTGEFEKMMINMQNQQVKK